VYANPDVLVGYETADDAAVYRLDDRTALVQTVDFFTPIVDDPFVYGQIAAANALSDVYAMGGTPVIALSVVGFPRGLLEVEVLHEIMRGGAAKMMEAKVAIVGGHSVQDPELKFGYCVTGFADLSRIYTNRTARPGDVLFLTKPLGSGVISTAVKRGLAPPEAAAGAVEWMLQLNAPAAAALRAFPVHAVTDVTGYGLLGHALEVARASQVTLHLETGRVPVMTGAWDLGAQGLFPGGVESNRAYCLSSVNWSAASPLLQKMLLDPQTSGGLLVSLPAADAPALADEFARVGVPSHIIGSVAEPGPYAIELG
jgi:selenide,water dikinase